MVLGDLAEWAALLAGYESEEGETILGGLEPLWGFSCPILTPDPPRQIPTFVAEIDERPGWAGLVITGLAVDSVLYHELTRGLIGLGEVYRSPGIERCIADLSDGSAAWLARRSPRFRRQWRRWHSEAEAAGIEIVDVTHADGLMDRLLEIEKRSWKGRELDGITSPTMQRMYRSMIDRLSERGRLLASIARLGAADVGFIVGGVRAGIYRGLQLSYADSVADLSVGHVLQAHQILALADTPVHTYDMGMNIDYKRRWADEIRPTVVVRLDRRR